MHYTVICECVCVGHLPVLFLPPDLSLCNSINKKAPGGAEVDPGACVCVCMCVAPWLKGGAGLQARAMWFKKSGMWGQVQATELLLTLP